jgi:enhancing lycopene biosynthesis protein 2
MKKIAVIIAGCGHLDGAEIRESILTLLELDRNKCQTHIFAPDQNQADVVNHCTGEAMQETRNVLVEAARIARGDIASLEKLNADNFDALILPGGFGAAKNLSTIATDGANALVNPQLDKLIRDFHTQKKPIGAICISPAIVARTLADKDPVLTLGGHNQLLDKMMVRQAECTATDTIVDTKNKLVSTPAYMGNAHLHEIQMGIAKLVSQILEMCK